MGVDGVADASLMGAAFFNERHSEEARLYLAGDPSLIAPSFLLVEMASIAAKKVWRSEASLPVARKALASVREFVAELVADEGLAARGLELAATHHFSAYDALYVALAEQRNAPLLTFDDRLIACAQAAGLPIAVERPRLP